MARIRNDGTILLNALQMATYLELKEKAVDGKIHRDVAATYKQNVINSLVRHGVMKIFQKVHYKLIPNTTIIDQPELKPRKPKIDVAAMAGVEIATGVDGVSGAAA